MANYPNWVNIDNGQPRLGQERRARRRAKVEDFGVQSPQDLAIHPGLCNVVLVSLPLPFRSYFECNNYRRIAAFAIMQICLS